VHEARSREGLSRWSGRRFALDKSPSFQECEAIVVEGEAAPTPQSENPILQFLFVPLWKFKLHHYRLTL